MEKSGFLALKLTETKQKNTQLSALERLKHI